MKSVGNFVEPRSCCPEIGRSETELNASGKIFLSRKYLFTISRKHSRSSVCIREPWDSHQPFLVVLLSKKNWIVFSPWSFLEFPSSPSSQSSTPLLYL